MAHPDSVLGFKVVGLRFSEGSKAGHQLLLKQHSVRTHSDTKPPDRTLFIVNVPPYCTKESFERLFSEFGKVRDVFFHKRPTSGPPPQTKHPHFAAVPPVLGFKVAYVVFAHPSSLKKVLALPPPNTTLTLASEEQPVVTGLRKWQQEYNNTFVTRKVLAAEVASVMGEYDARKERERAGATQEPDSEGWVTVTSEKKKKPQLEKVDELNKKKNKRKKKRKQEMVHFYSFQQRQAKMDHLAQLRKKFEEDKNKITQMRMSRKFRPY